MTRDRAALMSELTRSHDAVRLRLGPQQLYYFTLPEHAQHVLTHNASNYEKGIGQRHARRALGRGLLTNEGPGWRAARRTLSPAFRGERSSDQGAIVDRETVRMVRELRHDVDPSAPVHVDAQEMLTKLTIRILGPALFDRDLTVYTQLAAAFDTVQAQAVFEMLTLNAVPPWLPLPRQRRFRRALDYLDAVADDLHARWHGDASAPDLVSLTRTSGATDAAVRRHLRDELVTMLLAGHETTATTLTWALTLLEQQPEVRARIRSEALEALPDEPVAAPGIGPLLRALPYTTAVVHEVARLYPAVWLLSRQAKEADTIGGFAVPAGAQVVLSPYALHRDPRFWDHPDEFRPSRFLSSFPDVHRYAYLPFGAGPRSCVGQRMGMTEAVVSLARLCRELDFSAVGKPPRRSEALLTLKPATVLRLAVTAAPRRRHTGSPA